jgi:sugar phosphate permease
MEEVDRGGTVKKVFWRLMPVLFVSYILAYIDRINIGFAAIKLMAPLI